MAQLIAPAAQDPRIDGTLKLTEQGSGVGGSAFMATLGEIRGVLAS